MWSRRFRLFEPASGIGEYNCLVRVKTSITLPEDLLHRLDRVDKNRSALLEKAALAWLANLDRHARDRKDIEIINRNARRLNREAMETLEYQRLS
jgi:metal-responsive CopG/Arc/MetJ family transcriptional regulator